MKKILGYSILFIAIFTMLTACAVKSNSSASLSSGYQMADNNPIIAPQSIFLAESTAYYPATKSTFTFDNSANYWKWVDTYSKAGTEVNVFVPEVESKNKWSEKIETTYTEVSPEMTVAQYYKEKARGKYADICYFSTPQIKILAQSPKDILYEYQITECGKLPSLAIIGRIVRTPYAITTIKYTVETEYLEDSKREYMLSLIMGAQLI